MALNTAYDHDGSGRPLLSPEQEVVEAAHQAEIERLRNELQNRPAFIHEALGDLDAEKVAEAKRGGYAHALLGLVHAAVVAKREREVASTLRNLSPRGEEADALAHLARLYA